MPPSTSSGDIYEETLAVFDERATPFEPLTTPEIADALGCGRRAAYKRLDKLVDCGEVETKKVGSGARVWWRVTDQERAYEEADRSHRAIVRNFPTAAIALFDHDLRYTIVGGTDFEDTDPTAEDMEGRQIGQLAPDQRDLLREHCQAALNGESRSFEFEFEERIKQTRTHPVRDENGDVFAGLAMTQDITERKRRERELEESKNRYKALVDNFPNGIVTLFDEDFRYQIVGGELFDEFEISPGDVVGRMAYEHSAPEDTALLEPAYEAAMDGDSTSFETEYAGRTVQLRIVPIRDDTGTVFAGMAMSQDITEQKRQEEELAALNRLNQVFQKVTHAIIESSSRRETEQMITEQLTNSDSYEYAWIGHLDRHGENIVPQIAGTNEADISEIPLSSATDDPTSYPPAAEVIRTGEVQVIYDSTTDPVLDQWKQPQDIRHQAGISVPIAYEDRVYGVLNVYTARENAFDENERRIVGRIGEVVGQAVNAIERKRALVENRVQELTFQSHRFAEIFTEAAGDESFTISIEKLVPLPDDRSIAYYSLDGLDPTVFVDIIKTFNPDAEYHVTDEEGSGARVEVQRSNLTLASELAKYNSWIVDGTIQNGQFRLRVHVPKHSHVREIKDVIKEAYSDVEVVAQTEVERENPRLSDVFSDLDDQLTERQRTTLEVGYHSGFFDWPRAITGEELAERLDVTPGTVSHHLRHGERKLMAAFFESTA